MAAAALVCLVGARGRMGQRVVRLLREHPQLRLAVALVREGAAPIASVPTVCDACEAVGQVQVVIDFSAPAVCQTLAPVCAELGKPYVVASTGLGEADFAAIHKAAVTTAIVQAANFSIGVNVMLELVQAAAAKLQGFDTEIFEIHHRHKRDAPSGTALALGEAVTQGAGERHQVLGRQGHAMGERGDTDLGYGVLRGGEVPGEHTVYYFGRNERLEITHRSANGDIFAEGALLAARWLLGRPAGRYSMLDVLRQPIASKS